MESLSYRGLGSEAVAADPQWIPIDALRVKLKVIDSQRPKDPQQDLSVVFAEGRREVFQVIGSDMSPVSIGATGKTRDELTKKLHEEYKIGEATAAKMVGELLEFEKVWFAKFHYGEWNEWYAGVMTIPDDPSDKYLFRIAQVAEGH